MRSHLLVLAKVFFWCLLVYYCLLFFGSKWETLQLSIQFTRISVKWLVAASIFIAGYYLMVLVLWLQLLHRLGMAPTYFPLFRAYALALLPKYLPGVITAYGVRTHLSQQASIPLSVAVSSLALELALTLSSAIILSLLGYFFYPQAVSLYSQGKIFFVLGTSIGLLAIVCLFTLRWQKGYLPSQFIRSPQLLFTFWGLYTLAWCIFGLSHWCLAQGLAPRTIPPFSFVMTACALSWVVGFLSFIAPAGLGVREGVLYFLMQPWLGEIPAILFVTLSRLLMFGVEVILTGIGLLSSLISRRP
jgi:glycosyltransferase 2 family protein